MRDTGIEIDTVPFLNDQFLIPVFEFGSPFQHKEDFLPWMGESNVSYRLLVHIEYKRLHQLFFAFVTQGLIRVSKPGADPVKLPTLIFSHQNNWEILILVAEEIGDLGVQSLGNGEKGGYRRRDLSIFYLREKTLGKVRPRSQLLKGDALLQSRRADPLTKILFGRGWRHFL